MDTRPYYNSSTDPESKIEGFEYKRGIVQPNERIKFTSPLRDFSCFVNIMTLVENQIEVTREMVDRLMKVISIEYEKEQFLKRIVDMNA